MKSAYNQETRCEAREYRLSAPRSIFSPKIYLGNSIERAKDDLVNMSVEEKSCPLIENLLKKAIYSLSYLLRKL